MRILIIETDRKRLKLLLQSLGGEGFALDVSQNGAQACLYAKISPFDLIILGHVAAPLSSTEVCREIRTTKKTVPIIGLCNGKQLHTKLHLFEAGVDDCLSTPFASAELLARVEAVTRRLPTIQPGQLAAGDVILDRGTHRTICGKKEIRLSRKEFAILELLFLQKGTIVSRSDLLNYAWNQKVDTLSHVLETHIHNIRKKFGRRKGNQIIQSIAGRGYMVEDL